MSLVWLLTSPHKSEPLPQLPCFIPSILRTVCRMQSLEAQAPFPLIFASAACLVDFTSYACNPHFPSDPLRFQHTHRCLGPLSLVCGAARTWCTSDVCSDSLRTATAWRNPKAVWTSLYQEEDATLIRIECTKTNSHRRLVVEQLVHHFLWQCSANEALNGFED